MTLSKLLRDITQEQATAFAARQQNVTLTLPSQPVKINADADLMRMALENIIDNAGKYSHQHTTIEVYLQTTDTEVIVTVKDHGVGIARKDHDKLFQKFSRINNPLSTAAGGSGLGLYWSKKIIDMHRGRIEMTSKAQQGSTFTITLPLKRRNVL